MTTVAKNLPTLSSIEQELHKKMGWLPLREYPVELESVIQLAEYYLLQYLNERSLEVIEESYRYNREILNSEFFTNASITYRLDAMNRFAIACSLPYTITKKKEYIDEAIAVITKAIRLAPAGWEDTCNYLFNLSSFYSSIYDATGELYKLEKAVVIMKKAIESTPYQHRNAGFFYYNQLLMIDRIYAHTGILKYLDEAIRIAKFAIEEVKTNLKHEGMILSYSGSLFRKRFLRSKSMADLDQAIEHGRQSTDQKFKVVENEIFAGRLSNLGCALLDKSRFDGFQELLDEAAILQKRVLRLTTVNNQNLASRLNNLGNCYDEKYHLKGKTIFLDQSIKYYSKAITATKEGDPILPTRLYNLANAYRAKFYATQDRILLTKSIELYEKACTLGLKCYPEWALFASMNWGNLMSQEQDFKNAIVAYEFGLNAINLLFERQFSENDKNTWLKDATELSHQLAFAQVACKKDIDAIITLEQSLARNLREKLQQNQSNLQDLKQGDEKLYEDYRRVSANYKAAVISGSDSGALSKARLRVNQVVEQIRGVEGFQEFLKIPNEALVEKALKTIADYTLIYFIVANDKVVAITVTTQNEQRNIKSTQLDIDAKNLKAFLLKSYVLFIKTDDSKSFKLSLDELWPYLSEKLGELLPTLTENKNIVLVLAGFLDLLPITSFFPMDYNVTITPSLLTFEQIFKHVNNGINIDAKNALGMSDTSPIEAPLEFSSLEMDTIQNVFSPNVMVCSKENATKSALLQNLPKAQYLHFSCHSYFNWTTPLDSGIQLFDEMLTMKELFDSALNLDSIRLVNLASCQSGISDIVELPDEAISLPASFMVAGVPGIISSLWSVSDISTAILMKKFYQLHIRDGVKPVTALRLAQQWISKANNADLDLAPLAESLYNSGKNKNMAQLYLYAQRNPQDVPFSHPYYWAGFYYWGV